LRHSWQGFVTTTPGPHLPLPSITKSVPDVFPQHILFRWASKAAKLPNERQIWHRGPATGSFPKATTLHPSFEIIGAVAAVITTLAWLPQILKILRERQAKDISLATTAALAFGVFLWVVYGLAIGSTPVIAANTVSFLFIAAIVGLKLRFG
jgi:MtN3 and saliva related transmembrane protein